MPIFNVLFPIHLIYGATSHFCRRPVFYFLLPTPTAHCPPHLLLTSAESRPNFSTMTLLHCSSSARLFLVVLDAILFLSLSTAAFAETHRADIIGYYTLHPLSHQIASNESCPLTLETQSFDFAINVAPTLVTSPPKFNIRIPHATSLADNHYCMAGTSYLAVTYDHPFVVDRLAAVRAWAGAGNEDSILPWLLPDYDSLVPIVASSPWIIAYDFTLRVCSTTSIASHAAYLYFQPPIPFNLSNIPLSTSNKYMALAFGGRKRSSACLYVAQRVGGDPPYHAGPVSDPSENITHPTRPEPNYNSSVPLPSGIALPSGIVSPTPSTSTTPSPTPSPLAVSVTQEPVEVTPSPLSVFGNVENDPDGPLGGVVDSSVKSSCFSRSNAVSLLDNSYVRMERLRIGHSVRVNRHDQAVSPVYFFSHQHDDARSLFPYLNISFESSYDVSHIIISKDHYMYARRKNAENDGVQMLTAGDLDREWHQVVLKDGLYGNIVSIERVYDYGLYSPHTLHGDIVVNNVVVSTYTKSVHPEVAHHLLLRPIAWLYRLGLVSKIQPYFTHYSTFVQKYLLSSLPSGPANLKPFT